MRRWLRLGLALVLALVAAPALYGAGAAEREEPSIRLFDLTTARDIVDSKPFQATRLFAPDEDAVYLWYAAEGCTVGTTIRSIWLYLETDPPSVLAEGSVTVERSGNWGQFNFSHRAGKRWAVGRYRVELWVGDDMMAETTFSVFGDTLVAHGDPQPAVTPVPELRHRTGPSVAAFSTGDTSWTNTDGELSSTCRSSGRSAKPPSRFSPRDSMW